MDADAALQRLADALDRTGALVAGVSPEAMDAPTPCPPWDVERLTEHLVQELRHFTSTASGEEWDASRTEDSGGGGTASYERAAGALVEAWRRGGSVTNCWPSPGQTPTSRADRARASPSSARRS